MATTPQRIVELLKEEIPAKISLNQFCKKTGINPNSVDKYMAGVAEPNLVSLRKIASYFGVSVSYLLEESILDRPAFYDAWDKILSGYQMLIILALECYDEISKDDFLKKQARQIATEIVSMSEEKRGRFNSKHFNEVKRSAFELYIKTGDEFRLSILLEYWDTIDGSLRKDIVDTAYSLLQVDEEKESVNNLEHIRKIKKLAKEVIDKTLSEELL